MCNSVSRFGLYIAKTGEFTNLSFKIKKVFLHSLVHSNYLTFLTAVSGLAILEKSGTILRKYENKPRHLGDLPA